MKCPRCQKWIAICNCPPVVIELAELPRPPLREPRPQATMPYRDKEGRLILRKTAE